MIIEILKAILFGLVEGVTEWLPVSSTGHMILVEHWVSFAKTSEDFWKMFEVVIQLGAILAVVVIFWDKLWPWRIKNVKVKGKMAIEEKVVFKDGALDMWCKIIVACIPAAVVGIVFDDLIDRLFYHPVPVALALIVVGVIFIIIESTSGQKQYFTDVLFCGASHWCGTDHCRCFSGNEPFRSDHHRSFDAGRLP